MKKPKIHKGEKKSSLTNGTGVTKSQHVEEYK